MVHRIHNFNPGPCALPLPVLEKAAAEMFDYKGTGMSVMEVSHRSAEFDEIINDAGLLMKDLLGVPESYHVLFLGGGASTQFYFIPMNFLGGGTADYVNTGSWSKKAIKEAGLYGTVNIAGTSEETNFNFIPKQEGLKLTADAKYVHYTSNNTIFGTEFHYVPETGNVPLICDMSSDIMSRPVDVSKFGLIYAGAQKNLGPSGVTAVVVSDELIEAGAEDIPTMTQYRTHAGKNSLFNTPPCWNIYILKLFLEWVKDEGGLAEMNARAQKKADLIYGAIDEMGNFYKGHAEVDSRSRMNATFNLPTEEMEKQFVAEAAKEGLGGVKGHRSVGGIRISMYNATAIESVKAVVDLMEDFRGKNK
ncbi:MAG: 3-phosphoserine/phosphohydroxythreonine transaminase [Candidatus Coatesbacteria bacterium]|nr:MAG: 3-phosphoserine/phosphohydroxythreonine transaminase [Candidatus Coatesbacteria bacterium]